jgi:outer membrane protein OmpA-like peptidoglycan-associated protein
MKKLYICCIALLLSSLSFSQLRLSVLGGPQWASVNESNSIPGWDSTTKPNYTKRTSINIGLLADVPIGESGRWFLQPGVFYSGKGRKYAQVNDTVTAAISDTLLYNNNFYTNYIDIPVSIAHKFPLGKKSSFLVSAGPYLALFFNGKNTIETRAYSTNKFNKEEINIDAGKATNKVKTSDFGVNVRAGFELGSILLTAFYSQGFTNFYTASYDGTFKHRVIGASVGFGLTKAQARKPKDRDKDGVPDVQDLCPTIAGTVATNGCPDADNDGIADANDKCPQLAGLPKYSGCPIPDTDKDGINDEEDKCPEMAGLPKYNGCPIPDSDGDGINDEADQCPDKAGTPDFNGCPIPDSDGDGLNDKEDKCPQEAGSKENNGCPEIKKEIVEKVNYAAKNIFFDLNSDKILQKSFDALNEVAEILKENSALRLSIEGHSDNAGKANYNLALSQKRAEAVKAYLIAQGIDPGRLAAQGFGQEKPIADNKTSQGRAQNRRVELKLEQD